MPEPAPRRLGWLLLGYLGAVVAMILLAPFRFDPGRLAAATWEPLGTTELRDVVLNVVLFLPLGFLLERVRSGRLGVGAIALLAAAVALAAESLQLMIPGRYSALTDVAANGAGAALGAVLSRMVRLRVAADAALAGRLFLDLPLVGLCWLMVPLVWLQALGRLEPRDAVVAATLALAVGVALAAAGRSGGTTRWPLLAPMAAGWALIALLPLGLRDPRSAALALAAHALGFAIADLWWGRAGRTERRVEPGTILVIAALLLPWLVTTDPSVGSFAWRGDGAATRLGALAVLERLVGCTVIGYALAEWRGRAKRQGIVAVGISAVVTVAVVALVHWPVATPRLLLTALGAGLGATIYQRQRAAVLWFIEGGASPVPQGPSRDS